MSKEIELVKQEIKMLQSKLEFLEELEKTKTPVEEAYKEWWGEYPAIKENGDEWDDDDVRWDAFRYGWWAAQPKDVGVPECPDEPTKPMDEVVDRLVKKYQSQKLRNMLKVQLDYDGMVVDDILEIVEEWLPKEQSASGSQNVDTELLVEGHNHCLQKMREMLR